MFLVLMDPTLADDILGQRCKAPWRTPRPRAKSLEHALVAPWQGWLFPTFWGV